MINIQGTTLTMAMRKAMIEIEANRTGASYSLLMGHGHSAATIDALVRRGLVIHNDNEKLRGDDPVLLSEFGNRVFREYKANYPTQAMHLACIVVAEIVEDFSSKVSRPWLEAIGKMYGGKLS